MMSPNMLSVTITSNRSGASRKYMQAASTWHVVGLDVRELPGDLLERPLPQVAREGQHVGLVHERERAAPVGRGGQLERVAHAPLDPVARVDRLLHRDLVGGALPVETAGAAVEPLGVLPNHHEVHVVLGVTRHERRHARIAHDRAQVHPLVELEPDLAAAGRAPGCRAAPAGRRPPRGTPRPSRRSARAPRREAPRPCAGTDRRRGRSPRGSRRSRRTASSTLRPSPTTSGPVPSPADHPDPCGSVRHGVTSLVWPASLAWTCRARFTAAR